MIFHNLNKGEGMQLVGVIDVRAWDRNTEDINIIISELL